MPCGERPAELPRSHNLSPFLNRGRHVTRRAAPGLFVFERVGVRLSQSVTSDPRFRPQLLQIEMNGVGRAELSRSVTLNPVLGVYLLQIETNVPANPLNLNL